MDKYSTIEKLPPSLRIKLRLKVSQVIRFLILGLTMAVVGFTVAIGCQSQITPASVSVRGYQRSDGTYVSAYNRRLPGSVNHDAPYEAGLFIFGVVGLIGCWLIYTGIVAYRGTSKEVITKYFTEKALQSMYFKIGLPNKPFGLVNSAISRYGLYKTYHCSQCHGEIGIDEFHISDMKKKSPRKYCLSCSVRKNEVAILNYIDLFNQTLNLFEQNFVATFNKLSGFSYNLPVKQLYYWAVIDFRQKEKA